jgi:UDP-N-acetylglucosamine--N-acetylmuramyl-(pentapeptide) pyrophosphoryl-undecaprenol N-acetylglucosamine transferase
VNTASPTVVIAGGGTGGHLYPGLAVARALIARRPEARVSFAGTARGLEARVVPQQGFELDLIRSAGLKGRSLGARVRGASILPLSFLDAWSVLSRRRPDVVVGVGGYSSGPVVLLAAVRGIATMVLEQNAAPGLTNRTLAPFVRAAAVTYEDSLSHFRGRGFVSGNPVRPEFLSGTKTAAADAVGRPPRLLVLGGSQGAHAINLALMELMPDLMARCPGLEVLHQTGPGDLAAVREAYGSAGLVVRAEAFVDDVASEMRRADIVVSRAGATTLAELAALGIPAILVPFPAAADDHQRKNAEVLVRAGAAVMFEQRAIATPEGRRALVDAIAALAADPDRRHGLATAMRAFARPDAAEVIVSRLLELAA